MSIEDVALKRDDSDIIQFDNIFSNDLAREQQLDLLFGEKEDDDIIRMIESRLFDSEGNERVFVEAEDDEDEDENNEEEGGEVDISDNDADGDNVDDDMEEPAAGEGEASPKIAIDIDADNVNINADPVKEDGDVNVTAQVANISPKADEDAPMTGEDLAAALTKSDDSTAMPEEIPAPVTPGDNEPAPAPDQKPVNGSDDVIGDDFDTTKPEPAVGDSDEDEFEEGVQELNTASDLEDALNKGLDEPAPAPEETSPVAEPEDPSTEVVFGDSNDMEEKCDIYGEGADGAVRPEDDTVIGDDDGNITHGEAPKNANDGIPETDDPAHKDTSETQVGFLPRTAEELEDAMGVVDDLDIAKEAAKEPEDPEEENVENDAEASLLSIPPTLTAGDLDKMFNTAEEDPNKDGKYSMDLNEGDEPVKIMGVDIIQEEDSSEDDGADLETSDAGVGDEPSEEKCGEKCNEAECPNCDSEPAEDEGDENIDNGFKQPETADDLAKKFDNMVGSSVDAEKAEKETISGEEGVESKGDLEWQDAVAKDDITSDSKFDAAKDETGYKDNRDAGDQDADKDELNEAETADDLEYMLSDIEDEAEPDPTDGEAPAECGSSCNASYEESDLTGGISDEKGFDGGNKSDDNLSADDFETKVADPKNDGDDEPIVDDQEQAGTDKEDGGAINTADANPTIPPATAAELEAALDEIAADSTQVIPDEVEAPKEDLEYDETVVTTKVAAPGNDGSDEDVCVAAESAEDLEQMFNEDFEDQVEGISDDDVFEDDINTGLEGTPEDEELDDEIDDEAIEFVESMK